MLLVVTVSLALLLLTAKLFSGNRRSVTGWAAMLLSAVPPVLAFPLAKAMFTWLPLLGIAGLVVTLLLGLRAAPEAER